MENNLNLAKLGDGLDEILTVKFGENNKKLIKNKGIIKPSWAFVETNIFKVYHCMEYEL